MSELVTLGQWETVWNEVVNCFDKRIPISKAEADRWLKRACEEKDPDDKVHYLFMFVIRLEGVAPYSNEALMQLQQGLVGQIGVMKIDEAQSDSEEDTEEHVNDMISRRYLDPGNVNAYLTALEQEKTADMFDDLCE